MTSGEFGSMRSGNIGIKIPMPNISIKIVKNSGMSGLDLNFALIFSMPK